MPAVDGVPDRLARYRVRSTLGRGGFAVVVLAHDEALDALVAVKILDAPHADDASTRERFVREGQLLRRVHSQHRAASASRHTTTTAREPMCFSSQMTCGTP
jgi:serine/threonine protein kinase